MVLKVSVTPDIDYFYEKISKSYDFTVCRGLLSFYDDDGEISQLSLSYSLNDTLHGKSIRQNNDDTIDNTKINVKAIKQTKTGRLEPIKKYKYYVTFPENLAVGMYNLTFKKYDPPGTHQMKIMMLPSQFRKESTDIDERPIHRQFKHQNLELIDDTFLKAISDCNKKLKSILVPEETNDNSDEESDDSDDNDDSDAEENPFNFIFVRKTKKFNYFKHIIDHFYQNMTSDKAFEYLSCLGLIQCKNNDSRNIMAVSEKIFYCITTEKSESNDETKNPIDGDRIKKFSEKIIKHITAETIHINFDDFDYFHILNNTKTNFVIKNIKINVDSSDYFTFNGKRIHYMI